MIASDRPRRSALYFPANNAKAVAKARTLPADVVILDLEDSVAPEMKVQAREAALAAVKEGGYGHREVVVRANGLDTEWGLDDLVALAGSGADAVLVPKVSSPEDIFACQAALEAAPENLALWAMIETCASIPQLPAIAATAATTRLSTWVMGVNDLAKEMRATQTPERTAFLPVLTMAVIAARAHGLVILDSVCNEFRDLDAFSMEAAQGELLGFDGKSLIHPDQIEPCNAAFSPSTEALRWANAIIEAFEQPEAIGKGVLRVEGKMVERLHLVDAKRITRFAETIALSAQTQSGI